MRHAGDGDQEIGHDAKEDQPGHVRRVTRAVDRLEERVRIDRRFGLDVVTSRITHERCTFPNHPGPTTPTIASGPPLRSSH